MTCSPGALDIALRGYKVSRFFCFCFCVLFCFVLFCFVLFCFVGFVFLFFPILKFAIIAIIDLL